MPAVKARILRLSLIRREEGFTLNEILVSIALIAIGVLGFSLNTMGVIQGNQVSASYTIATTLAQAKMEELKARTSFTNENNYDPSPAVFPKCEGALTGTPAPDVNITSTGAAGGIYERCWRITESSLGSGLKQIDVTVSWSEYLISRAVTLSTLVFTG